MYMIVLFYLSTLKSINLRPFSFLYNTNVFLENMVYKTNLRPYYRNTSLRILDSDFWALGHVGNSIVTSIVNLQYHLINTRYCIIYLHLISYLCSCDFYFNSEEH